MSAVNCCFEIKENHKFKRLIVGRGMHASFDLFLREYEQAYVHLTYEIVSSTFEQFVKRLLFHQR